MVRHGRGGRLLLWLAVLTSEMGLSRGQSDRNSPLGFLNIDCGKPKDYSYMDNATGLLYTSDHQYVSTGEIHKVSKTYEGTSGYFPQSYDLRSFPIGLRNCYTLPIKPDLKYLLRVSFMYGNYDGQNQPPQFALYAGVNYWGLVTITNASVNVFQDFILVGGGRGSMDLCLVNTGGGTPFISALEIRLLPDELYPQANSSQALMHIDRIDVGATKSLRYPEDVYDRIWTPSPPDFTSLLSTSSPVMTMRLYQPPSEVLQTAVYPRTGPTLNFSYSLRTADTGITDPRVHIFLHIAELQQLQPNESRVFIALLNNRQWSAPVRPTYLEGLAVQTVEPQIGSVFDIALEQTNQSTLPPILNAAEVYFVTDMTGVETARQDVDAILAIKTWYKLQRNWEGDPCLPRLFIWKGLNCSNDGYNGPRITSLNLNSAGLTGEISEAIGNLTQLEFLDLSNNNLTGGIPSFLASLTHLKFLDVTNNNLDGSVPKSLLNRSTHGTLTLRVGGGVISCNGSPSCDNKKKNKSKITAALAASVGCFVLVVALLVVFFTWRRNTKKLGGQGRLQLQGDFYSVFRKKHKHGSRHVPSLHIDNKQFTYKDLVRITNNFQTQIGRGGFGPVYHGVLENGFEVAIKLLSESSSQGLEEFQNEAILLTRIHHKHLVSLVGYCNDDIKNLALVYEYMAQGSLQDHVQGGVDKLNTTLNWMCRLRIAIEAAQGLDYLHQGCKPTIVHRDVKTNNILLNHNFEAKISDFGISKIFENEDDTHVSTKVVGTPGYLDPEYYLTNMLTEKSDVYSFGVVLLELVTGLPSIIKSEGNITIIHWVKTKIEQGNLDDIFDQNLHGDYDLNSVERVVEIALACTPPLSTQRPNMSDVITQLMDCLELEKTRLTNQNIIKDTDITNRDIPNEVMELDTVVLSAR